MPGITFDNDEDFELFYDHCKDLIINRHNTNLAQDADPDAMDELLVELEQWYANFEENGSKPDPLIVGEWWETLIGFFEDTHRIDEWKMKTVELSSAIIIQERRADWILG